MKTSWNETRQIEASIQGTLDTGEALLFEANLILNPELQDKILWQNKTYAAVHQYGRNQLKKKLKRYTKSYLKRQNTIVSAKI